MNNLNNKKIEIMSNIALVLFLWPFLAILLNIFWGLRLLIYIAMGYGIIYSIVILKNIKKNK